MKCKALMDKLKFEGIDLTIIEIDDTIEVDDKVVPISTIEVLLTNQFDGKVLGRGVYRDSTVENSVLSVIAMVIGDYAMTVKDNSLESSPCTISFDLK